jgi:hypothetical protein
VDFVSRKWHPKPGDAVMVQSPRAGGAEVVRVKPIEKGDGWSTNPVELRPGFVTVVS